MSDVFISYSRNEKAFVEKLVAALSEHERDAWVDWKGIPPTAEWMNEIFSAIDEADIFVFVISPHSVASEICTMEIRHAANGGKRLIPIVCSDVSADSVAPALGKLNWIFFRDTDGFATAFETLISALDTDLDWVRRHTRLLVRAREWKDKNLDNSLLLGGNDLEEMEIWLADAANHDEPQPTELHHRFLQTSRLVQTKRRRLVRAALTVVVVVIATIGAVAYFQSIEKRRQEALASARELATAAQTELGSDPKGLVRSTRRAVASLQSASTEEGMTAWRAAMELLSNPPLREMRPARSEVYDIAFAPHRQIFAAATADKVTTVYERATAKIMRSLETDDIARAIAFHPHQPWLAAGAGRTVTVWDIDTGKIIAELPSDAETIRDLAFDASGSLLAVASEAYAVLAFDTQTWKLAYRPLESNDRALAVAFSPNRQWLASGGQTLELWDTDSGTKILEQRSRRAIWSIAFDEQSNRLFAGGTLWRLEGLDSKEGNVALVREGELGETSTDFRSAAFSPDGRRLVTAANNDFGLKLWDVENRNELSRMVHPAPVRSTVFDPTGETILSGSDRIRFWSAEDSAGFTTTVTAATSAAFHPDGNLLATGGADGAVRVFDRHSIDWQQSHLIEHKTALKQVGFSPDGQWLFTLDRSVVNVFDTASQYKEPVFRHAHKGEGVYALFEPAGRWLIVSAGTQISLFATGSWQEVGPLDQITWVSDVAASDDGHWLAVWTQVEFVRGQGIVHPSMTRVWDLQTGEQVAWHSRRNEDHTQGFYDHPYQGGEATSVDPAAETGGRSELIEQAVTWIQQSLTAADQVTESLDGRWRVSFGKRGESARLLVLKASDMITLACRRLAILGADWDSDDRYHRVCDDRE